MSLCKSFNRPRLHNRETGDPNNLADAIYAISEHLSDSIVD
jgi:hypothetical protein